MLRALAGLLALTAIGAGCANQGPQTAEDYDSVITGSESIDFGALKTYRQPDHVIDGTDFFTDTDLEQFMLSAVDEELQAINFTVEANPTVTHPDVLVTMTVQETDFGTFVDSGYWSAWSSFAGWAWWGSFPGNWSPVYPDGINLDQFTSGKLHLDMVKPDPNAGGSLEVVWGAVIDGVDLENADARTRLRNLIHQAFQQSTYLRGDK